MKNCIKLPDGYEVTLAVDLQKNKKLALLVNGIGLVIAVLMVLPALSAVPISTLFDFSEGLGQYALRFGVLLVGSIAYIVLHELVHGICMRTLSGARPRYGFTGMYAYAGSDAYFNKASYIFIALAPVLLWGAVLAVINTLVPTSWFWVVYLIQITNCSGAGGDLYVTLRFLSLPRDILVQDTGVSMTVYAPKD